MVETPDLGRQEARAIPGLLRKISHRGGRKGPRSPGFTISSSSIQGVMMAQLPSEGRPCSLPTANSALALQRLEARRKLFKGYSAPAGFLQVVVLTASGDRGGGWASPRLYEPPAQALGLISKPAAELLTTGCRNRWRWRHNENRLGPRKIRRAGHGSSMKL